MMENPGSKCNGSFACMRKHCNIVVVPRATSAYPSNLGQNVLAYSDHEIYEDPDNEGHFTHETESP